MKRIQRAVILVWFAFSASLVAAQNPSKPVRLILGTSAGGPADTAARVLAASLAEPLGQAVVVENRVGAEGLIAADAVLKSAADGHTLLFAGFSTLVLAATSQAPPPFQALQDFEPVSLVGRYSMALFVHPGVPAQTVAEMVGYARNHAGVLNYGTAAAMDAFIAAQILQEGDLRMTRVQYKGAAQLMPDLMSGRIHLAVLPLSAGLPLIRDGRLRGLALVAERRSAIAPEIPTLREVGMANVSSPTWTGLFVRSGAPKALVEGLSSAVNAALRKPEMQEMLEQKAGLAAEASSPSALGELLRQDALRWNAPRAQAAR